MSSSVLFERTNQLINIEIQRTRFRRSIGIPQVPPGAEANGSSNYTIQFIRNITTNFHTICINRDVSRICLTKRSCRNI